jgi:hypothetical protein
MWRCKTILNRLRRGLVGAIFIAALAGSAPAQDPRVVAALADMAAMRDAEIAAYLDTGYLFSLEDLNDLLSPWTYYYFDDIMWGGGAQVISTLTGRYEPTRVDVRWPPHLWEGPYVTYQQGHFSTDGAGYDPGTPLDPWGNPYYLFTPLGLVKPTQGTLTLELYGDTFDRYAIVSLGPDGVVSDDDVILRFEGAPFYLPTRTVISSVNPATASPGQRVTLRGYNFGAPQGSSRVELGGRPLTTVVSWGDRSITFVVPSDGSSGQVVVVRPTERSNPFLLQVRTAARHWALYR